MPYLDTRNIELLEGEPFSLPEQETYIGYEGDLPALVTEEDLAEFWWASQLTAV